MVLKGEVVKAEGRVITITNEGETISLYVAEFASIKKEIKKMPPDYYVEAKFEDITVGDWLPHISVFINANTYPGGEAKSIMIAT